MLPSMIHQVHINYITKHHYMTIIPLIKKKEMLSSIKNQMIIIDKRSFFSRLSLF
jgi:hypothetical protein